MTAEENRERIFQRLTDLLRTPPLSVEYKAVKKPRGTQVIIEVTEEQLQYFVKQAVKKRNAETATTDL